MNTEQQILILNSILTFVTFTLKNKQNKKKIPPPKPSGAVLIQIGLTVDTISHHGKKLKYNYNRHYNYIYEMKYNEI